MNVKTIIKELKKLKVLGISDDTRYLQPQDLFVCLKGENFDGNDFIEEAIKKGAKAILTENDIKCLVPVFKVNNLANIFPKLLGEFYDYPQRELRIIGITGTDGKTTTATILEYLLSQKYCSCYIGTNGIFFQNNHSKSSYTTLPLSLLMRTLRMLANKSIKHLIMEVSSQGLVNGRLEGIEFEVAIFTNLSHEHLDTHKSMENYLEAKKLLFQKIDRRGVGIINIDSPYAKFFSSSKLITYGIDNQADYQAINLRSYKKYTCFDLITPQEITKDVKVNLTGKYNIYNVLAAIAAAIHLRINKTTILKALKNIPKISGRLELLTTTEDFSVYVDFAHTPNAIKEVLLNLKEDNKRLIIILGAAGEKDQSKRSKMGVTATSIADYVIFTSEDPRFEDPQKIVEDLTQDVQTQNYEIILNRKEAIQKTILKAKKNDIIIITGKGNDDYYEEKGIVYPYSDIEEALFALNKKKGN